MEDILGIFSFAVELTLEDGTLKNFQASLLTQESFENKKKKSGLLALHLLV